MKLSGEKLDNMEMKRKSPLQLQALERFYAEQKYPTEAAIEDLAVALDLTFNQVHGWFVEKRRSDKCNEVLPVSPSICKRDSQGRDELAVSSSVRSILKKPNQMCNKKKKKSVFLQDLVTANYATKNIFQEVGPSHGVKFDSLPSMKLSQDKDSSIWYPSCQQTAKSHKRRKVSKHVDFSSKKCNAATPVKRHGMGKGLMTVWRAINPGHGEFPSGIQLASMHGLSTSISQKMRHQNKIRRKPLGKKDSQKPKGLENKTNCKMKPLIRSKVGLKRDVPQMQLHREKCELALGVILGECLNNFAMLLDDEEVELRELEAVPNALKCSDHCATNSNGCSLCKDLLPKFPPSIIKMKHPFTGQPWESSPESVKKLFKVFHFLYTYSVIIDVCPFTLDEFVQAFHDKDSLLLGKINVALLKLLLSDVQTERHSGVLSNTSIPCQFLALLHFLQNQENTLEFWINSLNPLTWAEILRQVLVAAGFGSKKTGFRRETLSKETSLMVKYGLSTGTLKGELFRLLLERENFGLKISDLAKFSRIAELNLASTAEELELLICSTLSGDITLFEKISSSSYRLRISALAEESSEVFSDSEDSGSVHNDFGEDDACSSDSENSNLKKLKLVVYSKGRKDAQIVNNEIDESHPGEVWLLGLMDGEYSDLSINEKLSALVALVDLVSAGSSIRLEDSSISALEPNPTRLHYGSGAKIKRACSNKHDLPRSSWVHTGQMRQTKESSVSSKSSPIDSSVSFLKFRGKFMLSSKGGDAIDAEPMLGVHPMQSIFLGSDRRYNRYWLFLGPCHSLDPGHRRIYFESSEDCHWGVIDTEEALHTLTSVLDDRGTREARLIASLAKREEFLCQEMSRSVVNDAESRQPAQSDQSGLTVGEDSSSPVSDVDNNLSLSEMPNDSLLPCGAVVLEAGKVEEENQKWIRLQQFDAWIWNFFYCDLNAVKHSNRSYYESLTRCGTCHDLFWRDEKHCKICHTTFELDFDLDEKYAIHSALCRGRVDYENFRKHKVLCSQLQSLKAAVHAIESAMPEEALVGAWRKSAHRLWVKRLRRTSSLEELLQVVADFVAAINEGWLHQWNAAQDSAKFMAEITSFFLAIPHTTSALALWLVQLDSLIGPFVENRHRDKQRGGRELHASSQ